MKSLIRVSKFINPRNGIKQYLDEAKYLEDDDKIKYIEDALFEDFVLGILYPAIEMETGIVPTEFFESEHWKPQEIWRRVLDSETKEEFLNIAKEVIEKAKKFYERG